MKIQSELYRNIQKDSYNETIRNKTDIHEVLAEFGTQETGVFDKDKLDKATQFLDYCYNDLDFFQKKRIKEEHLPEPLRYGEYTIQNPAPPNIFRTMGVDSLCSPKW